MIVPMLRSKLYTSLFLILAEGRGSELVRERAGMFFENLSSELPSSRTSSLPRPAGRSLKTAFRALRSLYMTLGVERRDCQGQR
ncbi:hypothetical protein BW686_02850 [Pseudomonas syringae]|uniref:Uncharacterized protein n=1 Tax=Pseudomonas syringae TaxID=317 RepID=A0A244EWS2_PSESX|nr:hypothetical protein BW686_02850 [Pseudomonas syringae]